MADKDGVLLRIKSQYILNNVTSFVNKFVLYNLIAYSKLMQSKLNITLDDYKPLSFIKKSNLDLNIFFYFENYCYDYKRKLNFFLGEHNITKRQLEEYIAFCCQEKKNEIIRGKNCEFSIFPYKININSQFFDFLLTKEFCYEFF